MGGLLILTSALVPTLLWADLSNPYIWIAVLSTVAFGAIIWKTQNMVFSKPSIESSQHYAPWALAPLFAHLALVILAGIWLPEPLVAWFKAVAGLLG